MKAFVTVLVESEGLTGDEIEDEVVGACEEYGIKILWHKHKQAENKSPQDKVCPLHKRQNNGEVPF